MRFVQVGRGQLRTTAAGGGITIFQRHHPAHHSPCKRYYKLSTEMFSAGTLHQLGGVREVALGKGAALDPVIAQITGGLPYLHYIGLEYDEQRTPRSI